ncbi:hypothetical protein [Hydrogenophaga sp.]|uniref:hypothetical protein n=1 Tax=Hydrogenophaga sp. TaxID=1904254 RepID=UPI00273172DC|nr:hypothetical protein [Hydrogenophaga sp.]MDP2074190.1 hypothetical protein [Hydrogenophaga sp.]MDP3110214.1 hypothetical protein [Hydrogenophaga sp.]MDP3351863.1 hypothetical protein [Hydrogenophaga sp.]MDZ4400170.1 hypothetical protein [Hydrogenophaga sp.]
MSVVNTPVLSQPYMAMSRELRASVEQFFARAEPEQSVLVVDSCGPVITSQFQILQAIGLERLSRMKEVHAFSGGAFALFVYIGLASGAGRICPTQLSTPENERRFREFHHPSSVPVARVLLNLLTGHTVFGSAKPVHDSMRYMLQNEFVDTPFDLMPANLHLHLHDRQAGRSIELSRATLTTPDRASLGELPMLDVISLCVSIPRVYGDDGRYGDPVYARDHRDHIKNVCANGAPTLVSTPWRTGTKDAITFVKCTASRYPKAALMSDMLRMIFNVRNRDWQRYASAAFQFPG